MSFVKNFLLPTSLLAGTIIGAGVFALPYVFERAGFGLGLLYLGISVLAYTVVYFLYADLMVRTPGDHRFVGFADLYFGREAFWFSIIMVVVRMVLSMTAFLILAVSFVNFLVPSLSETGQMLIFWFVASLAISVSLKWLSKIEFVITSGMIAIITIIFFLGIGNTEWTTNTMITDDLTYLLVPLGPIFFALSGRTAIPSVIGYFRSIGKAHDYKLIKKTLITATVVPAVVYILFIIGVFGLSPITTPNAVSGLVGSVSPNILFIIGILGFLSLLSTYILIGVNIKNILKFDLRFSKFSRILMVTIIPLLFYFVSSQDFIGLVGLVGGLFLALEGMFIIVMWQRANKKLPIPPQVIQHMPRVVIVGVFTLFLTAFVHEVIKVFL